MPSRRKDRAVLRALAERYLALCRSDGNVQRKADWRRLNNLQPCRPMLHVNDGLLTGEILPHLPERRVEDDALHGAERRLQWALSWGAMVGDDRVFDPWFTVRARMFSHAEGTWGVAVRKVRDSTSRGWRCLPVLSTMADLDRLKATPHQVVDPEPPLARELADIFGDVLPIHVDRSTVYPVWGGTDLSQAAGALFGLEELLVALCSAPEMVHRFMTFTRDAVLANLAQGETAGDWSTADSWYYRTPACCDALPDPQPGRYGAKLKEVARFAHAQEFDGVGPGMFEEFLFRYQRPILERFGRVTYGCCETLDGKLHVLRGLSNLAKIVSGPLSDPARYPSLFGDRCVISWRPVAAMIASERFDEVAQRKQLREGLAKLRGCNVEVHLHEPMTVRGDLARIRTWVRIAREEMERAQR